ncbi:MAG: outer membrane protein assembly factor BamD [Sphingobacteriaceae bacterium]|nr:outer membrane protein assembly factor BamD [Sphingobacteriaceae bacterium]
MKNTLKYSLVIITAFTLITSCDRFNKLLKSSDYDLKLKRADEYYKKENYIKAEQLYAELIPIFKGTEKAEEIYYYFSYCNYYMGDFSLSQYHFKNFTRQFPASKHTEECYFMNAYCYYLNSPFYSLDQTDTKNAIKEFQAFVDEYPESTRIDSCNKLVDKLRYKLEHKDYDQIKQYFNLADYFNDYKAVIKSSQSFVKEFPDSRYVDEVYCLIIEAYYLMALKSIPSKKVERLDGAIESYLKFVDLYPKSKYLGKAEGLYASCLQVKESIIKK